MVTQTGEQQAAKTELRKALAAYSGNTKHEVIISANHLIQSGFVH